MTNPDLMPGSRTETLVTDTLIAGHMHLVTKKVTIAAGADLLRGAVLGKVTATGKYKLSATAAGDGSEVPRAILLRDAAAAGGDQVSAIYQTGEFNEADLTLGVGHTLASIEDALNNSGIYLKAIVPSV